VSFWAYMLRCADGSYYVGHTDDLDARVGAHRSGIVPGYTQKRRPVSLVWSQEFADRDEAFRAERQVKGWSRVKKEALIRGDWEGIQLLSRKLFFRSSFDTPPAAATQDERTNDVRPNFAHPKEGLSKRSARSALSKGERE